jgi:hypothetical protein
MLQRLISINVEKNLENISYSHVFGKETTENNANIPEKN